MEKFKLKGIYVPNFTKLKPTQSSVVKRSQDTFNYGELTQYNYAGIYAILCNTTGIRYIGSTNNIGRRVSKHFSELKLNRHANIRFQKAYNEYGFDDFKIEIIEKTDSDLLNKEKEYQIFFGIDSIFNDKISGYWCSEEYSANKAKADKSSHKTEEYKKRMSKIKSNRVVQLLLKYDSQEGYYLDIVRYYESINEVISENPTFKGQPIRGVCNGSKKSAYGFVWKFIDENNELIIGDARK